jgi:hypothetical protein
MLWVELTLSQRKLLCTQGLEGQEMESAKAASWKDYNGKTLDPEESKYIARGKKNYSKIPPESKTSIPTLNEFLKEVS